jgi:hypothetical protein
MIDNAFSEALRARFEKGLTHRRLQRFGIAFARAIWTCGGNPRPIQRTLFRTFLGSLRENGSLACFEILPAGDPCENCGALRGRVWTIAQALEENPLPCRACLNTNENGFGWCRCEYIQRPTLGGEYEQISKEIEADVDAYFDDLRSRSNIV